MLQDNNQKTQQPIDIFDKPPVSSNIIKDDNILQNTNAVNQKLTNQKKYRYSWLIIIAILITCYCIFSKSALTISPIHSGTKIYLNNQLYDNKNTNIIAKFKIYNLTVSEKGYASYQKRILFIPYITKKISVNLSKMVITQFPPISKIIDNNNSLKLISEKGYKIFTLEQKDLTELANNNQSKNLEDILQIKNNGIALDFLSELMDYGLPNNFSILDNLVIFQITDTQSKNFLMIYNSQEGYLTATLPNVISYSTYNNKIYILNDKNEVSYLEKNDLKNSHMVTKFTDQIKSIYASEKGLYALAKLDKNQSKIEFLDYNNKLSIIDKGNINNFSMSDNSKDDGFYNKTENDHTNSYIINDTKTKKLEQYFPFVSFLTDGSYLGYDFNRINNSNNQSIETRVYKNDKILLSFPGEDKIQNIYIFNNNIILFYSNKAIIIPSI
jgi:hypothetical protein